MSIELEGDPKLQAILFVACPLTEYSDLLGYISLPVILVGIGSEITNKSTLDVKVLLFDLSFRVLIF